MIQKNLDLRILSPYDATIFTLNRVIEGKNTISVTGNVLRDYLTDLFPILELGTSTKFFYCSFNEWRWFVRNWSRWIQLQKHVQQLVSEGHLRWDS